MCIKIDPLPGEAPKMFGRHFDETDMVVSRVSQKHLIIIISNSHGDLSKYYCYSLEV